MSNDRLSDAAFHDAAMIAALQGMCASNLYDRAKARQQAFQQGKDAAFVTETIDACECPITSIAAALAREYADAMLRTRRPYSPPTPKADTDHAHAIAEMAKAISGLLAIINDDLTHARQAEHAEAINAARSALTLSREWSSANLGEQLRGSGAIEELRKVEWCAVGSGMPHHCPACAREKHEGHAADCTLARVLAGGKA